MDDSFVGAIAPYQPWELVVRKHMETPKAAAPPYPLLVPTTPGAKLRTGTSCSLRAATLCGKPTPTPTATIPATNHSPFPLPWMSLLHEHDAYPSPRWTTGPRSGNITEQSATLGGRFYVTVFCAVPRRFGARVRLPDIYFRLRLRSCQSARGGEQTHMQTLESTMKTMMANMANDSHVNRIAANMKLKTTLSHDRHGAHDGHAGRCAWRR